MKNNEHKNNVINLINHYVETLTYEVKRLDERESTEDSASIRQLVEKIERLLRDLK